MADERDMLLAKRGREPSTDTLWIPVTIHLPLGLAKSWTPSCAEFSVYTPLLAVIFFAQLANTVLVPVLPFMVTVSGADPIYYGVLQSAYWVVELVTAPILGGASDRYGRRAVIFGSLIVSSFSHAVLAMAPNIAWMFVARVISGAGFQLALCRAYFAETGPKSSRASSFGLIGVITGLALTTGPTLGGIVSGSDSPHRSAWFACALSAMAALFALRWRPVEPVEKEVSSRDRRKWVRIDFGGERGAQGSREGPVDQPLERSADGSRPLENVDDDDDLDEEAEGRRGDGEASLEEGGSKALSRQGSPCARWVCKMVRLNAWLMEQGVYPLLLLNTSFRFAFSIYKSSFAYFCADTFGWGAPEVGFALSIIGLLGIFVQGILLRIVVRLVEDGNTLYIGARKAARCGPAVVRPSQHTTSLSQASCVPPLVSRCSPCPRACTSSSSHLRSSLLATAWPCRLSQPSFHTCPCSRGSCKELPGRLIDSARPSGRLPGSSSWASSASEASWSTRASLCSSCARSACNSSKEAMAGLSRKPS